MTRRRGATFDLAAAIRDRGFTPRAQDAEELAEMLDGDEEQAKGAERALAKLGELGARAAMDRFSRASIAGRVAALRTLGRAGEGAGEGARAFLFRALDDDEPRVRRAAVQALAKHALATDAGDDVERALLERWPRAARDVPIELARAIAESLGKIGGKSSLEALVGVETDDRELGRIVAEARTKIERTTTRGEASAIDPSREAHAPTPVVFHCRAGLEEILRDEIDPALSPRVARAGIVEATLVGALRRLQAPRTALRFGFPLAAPRGLTAERALVDAMTSVAALKIVRTFTRGPLRYRIEWAKAGHRRAATFAAAAQIARARPELVNDPTASPWEVVVVEAQRGAFVELWPRGLIDDRFAWRRAEVQGASHPTIAAALARVAGVRVDDVVWDPFCGAGSELVERARLGPARALFGTDVDPHAIAAARENMAFSRIDAALVAHDARTWRAPMAPTLVVSNPPMGRRVSPHVELGALFEDVMRNVAAQLRPGGRIVWLSPLPDRTADVAVALGLRASLRRRVDLGGFSAELQRFDRA